ncbi:hypothetical protein J6590_004914 [Homalodisca vitripennis]|nr:hypothetical protein J6590_004914 [Homalodisca vitripennis]
MSHTVSKNNNKTFKITDVEKLVHDALDKVTKEDWQSRVQHAEALQQADFEKELSVLVVTAQRFISHNAPAVPGGSGSCVATSRRPVHSIGRRQLHSLIPKTTLFREKSRLVEAGKLPLSCLNRRVPNNDSHKQVRLTQAVAACKEGRMSQAAASSTFKEAPGSCKICRDHQQEDLDTLPWNFLR